jgi:dihydrofolate reductase
MRVSLVVAVAQNGVIGRAGELPWRLSEDLRRFKRITMGHTLVMGRRTFESIGRPLPGRRSIVVSRRADFRPAGVEVAASLPAALQMAADDDEVFVIGGGEIFREAFPLVERVYRTRVQASVEGDVRIDPLDLGSWLLVERSEHPADERNDYATTFEVFVRRT